MSNLCRLMAKGDADFFYKLLKNPITQAADNMRQDLPAAMQKLSTALRASDFWRKSAGQIIEAPELVYNMPGHENHGRAKTFSSKYELMEYLIHTLGNESNKRKLLVPLGWAMERQDGTLDSTMWDKFQRRMFDEGKVTLADVEAMQAIGDAFQDLLPKMQHATKYTSGAYMEEIPPTAFEFMGKKFRGWYVPVCYDRTDLQNQQMIFDKTAADSDALMKNSLNTMNTHFRAMMPLRGANGMTMSRSGYTGVVDTSFDLLPLALTKAYRFAYLSPAVHDVCKVVTNPRISTMIRAYDPNAFKHVIEPYLNAALTQAVEKPMDWQPAATAIHHLRTGAVLSIMPTSGVNILQQVTGLITAVPSVRVLNLVKGSSMTLADLTVNHTGAGWAWDKTVQALGKERMMRHTHNIIFGKGMSRKDIEAKSVRMKNLTGASFAEQIDYSTQILKQMNKYETAMDFVRANMYFGQSVVQNIVNQALWTAKYEESVEKGLSEEDSVISADRLIEDTQSTPFPEDKANWERGNAVWRASFNMFGGYWASLGDYVATNVELATRQKSKLKAATDISYILGMSVVATGMASVAIRNMFDHGTPVGEDDDDWATAFWNLFINGSAEQIIGIIPAGFRQAVSYGYYNLTMEEGDARSRYLADRIRTSPILSVAERDVRNLRTNINNEEDVLSAKFMTDIANTMTFLTHMPVGPAAQIANSAATILEGE
jgi:hypothetical protein